MAFRCNNCNGSVVFDIASQRLKCENCGSQFDPATYRVRDESAGSGEAAPAVFECGGCGAELEAPANEPPAACPYCGGDEMTRQDRETPVPLTLFECQNCGAALESTEDSMIGVCPYCGGQSMLKTGTEQSGGVERLIPFQVTKEKCAEVYGGFAKNVRYLPKELKDPAYLQNFTGIYMPFFEYDVEFGRSHISGTKTVESNSKYDVVNTYQIDAAMDGECRGVPYDASKYLDDEISDRLLPFRTEKAVPYHPAYLSGFYADTATVDPKIYYEDAAADASADVVAEVAKNVSQEHNITVDRSSAHVDATAKGHHSVLFPMWFLTWRRGDRVAYAVVNGESGKIVSDLPVDTKSFLLGCGVISVILFLLLELFFQPTPTLTSMLGLAGALVMALAVRSGAKKLYEKHTHANDKGWNGGNAGTKRKTDKKPGKFTVVIITMLVLFVSFIVSAGTSVATVAFGVGVVALLVVVVSLLTMTKWREADGVGEAILSMFVILLAVLLNLAIVVISPVNDGWYYLGDAVSIVGLLLASAGMLRTFNKSTTRPLPKLFGREEVR